MDVHQALQQALNSLMLPLDDYATGGELEEDHLGLDVVLLTGNNKAPPLGRSKQSSSEA